MWQKNSKVSTLWWMWKWVNEELKEWGNEWMKRWMNEWVNDEMSEWWNEWMTKLVNEKMSEWWNEETLPIGIVMPGKILPQ